MDQLKKGGSMTPKRNSLVLPLSGNLPETETGGKARSLLYLREKGYAVPRSYLVPGKVFERYRQSGDATVEQLRREVAGLPALPYAVRSSAYGEDGSVHSCAGQFLTLLNRKGEEEIIGAILEVWRSATGFTTGEYSRMAGQQNGMPGCAVIIQEMVDSRFSGVSFSRNPVTGAPETIIEAVEGRGEELVQKGTTPLRWKFRGNRAMEGECGHLLFKVVTQVASSTRNLQRSAGFPVDIEWAWDGRKLWFLQMRRITAQKHLTVYSSRMAGEMLPGQIKPLVWSVNIPLVVGAKTALAEEITGPLRIRPHELVRSFSYRTYFNLDKLGEILQQFGLPPESLETVMRGNHHSMSGFRPGWKTLRHLPRMVRFLRHKLRYPDRFETEYLGMNEQAQTLRNKLATFSLPGDYHPLFDQLYRQGQQLAHFNIVIPVLMRITMRRLQKKMEKAGIPFDQKRFAMAFPRLEEWSPVVLMAQMKTAYEDLPPSLRQEIHGPADLPNHPSTASLADGFALFMERFGHFSRSGNDFSVPKWEEQPDEVWKMILNSSHPGDEAGKMENAGCRTEVSRAVQLPRKLEKLWLKAGRLMVYREQISSLYILGYGLFRTFFLKTGAWLTGLGIIAERGDIFFLTREEVEAAIGAPGDDKCGA